MNKYLGGSNNIVQTIKNKIARKENIMSEVDVSEMNSIWDDINTPVGTLNELSNWSYSKNDANQTVTLSYHSGYKADCIVYGKYDINGTIYRTQLSNYIKHASTTVANPYMFRGNATYVNVNNNRYYLKSVIFNPGINYNSLTNATYMFYRCEVLEYIDMRNFETSNLVSMNSIFMDTPKLTLILASKDKWIIKPGCSTSYMFLRCGTDHVTFEDGSIWKP